MTKTVKIEKQQQQQQQQQQQKTIVWNTKF